MFAPFDEGQERGGGLEDLAQVLGIRRLEIGGKAFALALGGHVGGVFRLGLGPDHVGDGHAAGADGIAMLHLDVDALFRDQPQRGGLVLGPAERRARGAGAAGADDLRQVLAVGVGAVPVAVGQFGAGLFLGLGRRHGGAQMGDGVPAAAAFGLVQLVVGLCQDAVHVLGRGVELGAAGRGGLRRCCGGGRFGRRFGIHDRRCGIADRLHLVVLFLVRAIVLVEQAVLVGQAVVIVHVPVVVVVLGHVLCVHVVLGVRGPVGQFGLQFGQFALEFGLVRGGEGRRAVHVRGGVLFVVVQRGFEIAALDLDHAGPAGGNRRVAVDPFLERGFAGNYLACFDLAHFDLGRILGGGVVRPGFVPIVGFVVCVGLSFGRDLVGCVGGFGKVVPVLGFGPFVLVHHRLGDDGVGVAVGAGHRLVQFIQADAVLGRHRGGVIVLGRVERGVDRGSGLGLGAGHHGADAPQLGQDAILVVVAGGAGSGRPVDGHVIRHLLGGRVDAGGEEGFGRGVVLVLHIVGVIVAIHVVLGLGQGVIFGLFLFGPGVVVLILGLRVVCGLGLDLLVLVELGVVILVKGLGRRGQVLCLVRIFVLVKGHGGDGIRNGVFFLGLGNLGNGGRAGGHVRDRQAGGGGHGLRSRGLGHLRGSFGSLGHGRLGRVRCGFLRGRGSRLRGGRHRRGGQGRGHGRFALILSQDDARFAFAGGHAARAAPLGDPGHHLGIRGRRLGPEEAVFGRQIAEIFGNRFHRLERVVEAFESAGKRPVRDGQNLVGFYHSLARFLFVTTARPDAALWTSIAWTVRRKLPESMVHCVSFCDDCMVSVHAAFPG